MFRRMKCRFKLKIFKIKMNRAYKRWVVLRNRESSAYTRYNKASTDYYYAVEHFYPGKTWDARAEREFLKGNH